MASFEMEMTTSPTISSSSYVYESDSTNPRSSSPRSTEFDVVTLYHRKENEMKNNLTTEETVTLVSKFEGSTITLETTTDTSTLVIGTKSNGDTLSKYAQYSEVREDLLYLCNPCPISMTEITSKKIISKPVTEQSSIEYNKNGPASDLIYLCNHCLSRTFGNSTVTSPDFTLRNSESSSIYWHQTANMMDKTTPYEYHQLATLQKCIIEVENLPHGTSKTHIIANVSGKGSYNNHKGDIFASINYSITDSSYVQHFVSANTKQHIEEQSSRDSGFLENDAVNELGLPKHETDSQTTKISRNGKYNTYPLGHEWFQESTEAQLTYVSQTTNALNSDELPEYIKNTRFPSVLLDNYINSEQSYICSPCPKGMETSREQFFKTSSKNLYYNTIVAMDEQEELRTLFEFSMETVWPEHMPTEENKYSLTENLSSTAKLSKTKHIKKSSRSQVDDAFREEFPLTLPLSTDLLSDSTEKYPVLNIQKTTTGYVVPASKLPLDYNGSTITLETTTDTSTLVIGTKPNGDTLSKYVQYSEVREDLLYLCNPCPISMTEITSKKIISKPVAEQSSIEYNKNGPASDLIYLCNHCLSRTFGNSTVTSPDFTLRNSESSSIYWHQTANMMDKTTPYEYHQLATLQKCIIEVENLPHETSKTPIIANVSSKGSYNNHKGDIFASINYSITDSSYVQHFVSANTKQHIEEQSSRDSGFLENDAVNELGLPKHETDSQTTKILRNGKYNTYPLGHEWFQESTETQLTYVSQTTNALNSDELPEYIKNTRFPSVLLDNYINSEQSYICSPCPKGMETSREQFFKTSSKNLYYNTIVAMDEQEELRTLFEFSMETVWPEHMPTEENKYSLTENLSSTVKLSETKHIKKSSRFQVEDAIQEELPLTLPLSTDLLSDSTEKYPVLSTHKTTTRYVEQISKLPLDYNGTYSPNIKSDFSAISFESKQLPGKTMSYSSRGETSTESVDNVINSKSTELAMYADVIPSSKITRTHTEATKEFHNSDDIIENINLHEKSTKKVITSSQKNVEEIDNYVSYFSPIFPSSKYNLKENVTLSENEGFSTIPSEYDVDITDFLRGGTNSYQTQETYNREDEEGFSKNTPYQLKNSNASEMEQMSQISTGAIFVGYKLYANTSNLPTELIRETKKTILTPSANATEAGEVIEVKETPTKHNIKKVSPSELPLDSPELHYLNNTGGYGELLKENLYYNTVIEMDQQEDLQTLFEFSMQTVWPVHMPTEENKSLLIENRSSTVKLSEAKQMTSSQFQADDAFEEKSRLSLPFSTDLSSEPTGKYLVSSKEQTTEYVKPKSELHFDYNGTYTSNIKSDFVTISSQSEQLSEKTESYSSTEEASTETVDKMISSKSAERTTYADITPSNNVTIKRVISTSQESLEEIDTDIFYFSPILYSSKSNSKEKVTISDHEGFSTILSEYGVGTTSYFSRGKINSYETEETIITEEKEFYKITPSQLINSNASEIEQVSQISTETIFVGHELYTNTSKFPDELMTETNKIIPTPSKNATGERQEEDKEVKETPTKYDSKKISTSEMPLGSSELFAVQKENSTVSIISHNTFIADEKIPETEIVTNHFSIHRTPIAKFIPTSEGKSVTQLPGTTAGQLGKEELEHIIEENNVTSLVVMPTESEAPNHTEQTAHQKGGTRMYSDVQLDQEEILKLYDQLTSNSDEIIYMKSTQTLEAGTDAKQILLDKTIKGIDTTSKAVTNLRKTVPLADENIFIRSSDIVSLEMNSRQYLDHTTNKLSIKTLTGSGNRGETMTDGTELSSEELMKMSGLGTLDTISGAVVMDEEVTESGNKSTEIHFHTDSHEEDNIAESNTKTTPCEYCDEESETYEKTFAEAVTSESRNESFNTNSEESSSSKAANNILPNSSVNPEQEIPSAEFDHNEQTVSDELISESSEVTEQVEMKETKEIDKSQTAEIRISSEPSETEKHQFIEESTLVLKTEINEMENNNSKIFSSLSVSVVVENGTPSTFEGSSSPDSTDNDEASVNIYALENYNSNSTLQLTTVLSTDTKELPSSTEETDILDKNTESTTEEYREITNLSNEIDENRTPSLFATGEASERISDKSRLPTIVEDTETNTHKNIELSSYESSKTTYTISEETRQIFSETFTEEEKIHKNSLQNEISEMFSPGHISSNIYNHLSSSTNSNEEPGSVTENSESSTFYETTHLSKDEISTKYESTITHEEEISSSLEVSNFSLADEITPTQLEQEEHLWDQKTGISTHETTAQQYKFEPSTHSINHLEPTNNRKNENTIVTVEIENRPIGFETTACEYCNSLNIITSLHTENSINLSGSTNKSSTTEVEKELIGFGTTPCEFCHEEKVTLHKPGNQFEDMEQYSTLSKLHLHTDSKLTGRIMENTEKYENEIGSSTTKKQNEISNEHTSLEYMNRTNEVVENGVITEGNTREEETEAMTQAREATSSEDKARSDYTQNSLFSENTTKEVLITDENTKEEEIIEGSSAVEAISSVSKAESVVTTETTEEMQTSKEELETGEKLKTEEQLQIYNKSQTEEDLQTDQERQTMNITQTIVGSQNTSQMETEESSEVNNGVSQSDEAIHSNSKAMSEVETEAIDELQTKEISQTTGQLTTEEDNQSDSQERSKEAYRTTQGEEKARGQETSETETSEKTETDGISQKESEKQIEKMQKTETTETEVGTMGYRKDMENTEIEEHSSEMLVKKTDRLHYSHGHDVLVSTEGDISPNEEQHKPVIIIVNNSKGKHQKLNKSFLEYIISTSIPRVELQYVDLNFDNDENVQPIWQNATTGMNKSYSTCNKTDFESGKNCFCFIEGYLDTLINRISHKKAIDSTKNYCVSYIKFGNGLQIHKSLKSEKRERRGLIYMDNIKQKGDYLQYDSNENLFDGDFQLILTGKTLFHLPSENVEIPCSSHPENLIHEGEDMVWMFYPLSTTKGELLSEKGQELLLHEISVKNAGNYTCSPENKKDIPDKQSWHELELITFPIYHIVMNIFYEVNESCDLQIGDILHAYLPKVASPILCTDRSELCSIQMDRPRCLTREDNNYFNVTMNAKMNSNFVLRFHDRCDTNCKLKLYENMVNVIYKNSKIFERIPVYSHLEKTHDIHFIPHLNGKEGSPVIVKSPKIIVSCPDGFGLESRKQRVCVVCPAQTFSNEDEAFCRKCPGGQYQPDPGSKSCLQCNSPVDDKMCLRMLYSDTKLFKIYVGVAFGFIVLMVVIIVVWTSGINDNRVTGDRYYEGSLRHRAAIRRKDADLEIGANEPLLRQSPKRIPPQLPPVDF